MINDIYAEAFGGQFPVCTEEQKTKLEAAFKDAYAYEQEHGTAKHSCTCDLIIALMQPNVDRKDAIAAAASVARNLYEAKQGMEGALHQFLQMLNASRQDSGVGYDTPIDPKKVN